MTESEIIGLVTVGAVDMAMLQLAHLDAMLPEIFPQGDGGRSGHGDASAATGREPSQNENQRVLPGQK